MDLLNLISQDVGFNYTIDITMDHYGSRHVNESGEVYYNGIVGVVHRGVRCSFFTPLFPPFPLETKVFTFATL